MTRVPFNSPLANPLTILFSERSLFYWTIVHCTLGFVPKTACPRR